MKKVIVKIIASLFFLYESQLLSLAPQEQSDHLIQEVQSLSNRELNTQEDIYKTNFMSLLPSLSSDNILNTPIDSFWTLPSIEKNDLNQSQLNTPIARIKFPSLTHFYCQCKEKTIKWTGSAMRTQSTFNDFPFFIILLLIAIVLTLIVWILLLTFLLPLFQTNIIITLIIIFVSPIVFFPLFYGSMVFFPVYLLPFMSLFLGLFFFIVSPFYLAKDCKKWFFNSSSVSKNKSIAITPNFILRSVCSSSFLKKTYKNQLINEFNLDQHKWNQVIESLQTVMIYTQYCSYKAYKKTLKHQIKQPNSLNFCLQDYKNFLMEEFQLWTQDTTIALTEPITFKTMKYQIHQETVHSALHTLYHNQKTLEHILEKPHMRSFQHIFNIYTLLWNKAHLENTEQTNNPDTITKIDNIINFSLNALLRSS